MKKYYGVILVLILSFWAIKPLFVQGFFPMHDDTQVARVYEMGKALRDGMFPVRFVSDLGYGYGYPIFNFYAPFAYYVGGLLNLLGFNALIATKLMMGFGIALSGVFMYLLAKEFWGELGGITAALFYTYAPYHAVDIFVRGDISEFWAYAFIPLSFYGLIKTYKDPKWRDVIIGALGYAGVILSHNLTAMMVTPFMLIAILLYCYIAFKKKKTFTIYYLLFTVILGLALSAFYWLPAIFELKYTNILSQIGGGADFRNHFVCIQQLWNSPWGFGGSVPGCIDGMSFKIGKLHIIISLIVVFLALIFAKKIKNKIGVIALSLLGLIVSVFFTLEISKPVWEAIPQMAFFQYPWRFLILIAFFTSILSGFPVWFLQNRLNKFKYAKLTSYFGAGFLIFLLVYFNAKLFQPQTILKKSVSDYTNIKTIEWTTSKISDEYLPANFIKPKNAVDVPAKKITVQSGTAKVLLLAEKTQKISASIEVAKSAVIKLNLAYFPGWRVFLDNKPISFETANGIIFNLPQGTHVLSAEFAQTDIEKAANAVSLIGVLVLILGIIFQRRISKND